MVKALPKLISTFVPVCRSCFFLKKKYENIIKLNYANKCNLHAITNERTKTLAMPSKKQDHETANTQKQLKEKTKDMASL
jgi:hypothetical protein